MPKATQRVIGCIQVKGGAGRSTLATNLAGELSKRGKTLLVDCDMPQGTSASWYVVRQESGNAKGTLALETASSHAELIAAVERHPDARYVVLDAPPRIAEITRAILVMSDLCIVPVGASKAEIWATGDVLTLIDEARQVRPVNARMVWTRHRGFTNLAKELTEQAEKELGLPILKTVMALRVAYNEALGDGLTIAEMPDPKGKQEMNFLIEEISRIIR